MQKHLKEGKYTYNEDDMLGQGSFGKVFKGYNFQTKQDVALKQIQLCKLDTGEQVLKGILFSEITVMKKFNRKMRESPCPFLVRQQDVFRTDKHIYIVMEICEGGTLEDQIRSRRFKQKQCIQVLYCICRGLKYMNEMGVAHRDLKPQNIFISSVRLGKGEGKDTKIYKIGDFGFAAQKQQFETAMGTFPYMAPQMFKKQKYTNKVDVWSLGVIAYEIIFGSLFFIGKDKWQIQKNIKEKPFQLNQRQKLQVSSKYQDFLHKCLIKDPKLRIGVEQLLSHELFSSISKEIKQIESTVFEKQITAQQPALSKKITSEDYKQQQIFEETVKVAQPSKQEGQTDDKILPKKQQVALNVIVFSKVNYLVEECKKMRQIAEQFHLFSEKQGRQTQFIQIYLLKDCYVMMNRLTYTILHRENHIQLLQLQFAELTSTANSAMYSKLTDFCSKQCAWITGLFNQKYKIFTSYIKKFQQQDQQLIRKTVNEQPYDFVNSAVLEKELRKWDDVLDRPQYKNWISLKYECRRILDMKIKG